MPAEVGWTSGVVAAMEDILSQLRARGFEPLVTSSFVLALRTSTLTIETLSPRVGWCGKAGRGDGGRDLMKLGEGPVVTSSHALVLERMGNAV